MFNKSRNTLHMGEIWNVLSLYNDIKIVKIKKKKKTSRRSGQFYEIFFLFVNR